MRMTIERVYNGFVVEMGDFDLEGEPERRVYEDDEVQPIPSVHSAVDVIYALLEYFGINPSRYAQERVYVEVKPGDKWLSPDEAEEMLREDNPAWFDYEKDGTYDMMPPLPACRGPHCGCKGDASV